MVSISFMEDKKSNLIILDGIIYSLQRWGGISNYWNHVRNCINSEFKVLEVLGVNKIMSDNFVKSAFRPVIEEKILNRKLSLLSSPGFNLRQKYIFHSSYYRVSRDENALNVVTVHDFTYELHFSGIKRCFHVLLKRKALKRADYIICISHYTRQKMFELYPFTRLKSSSVIYNGVEDFIQGSVDTPFNEDGFCMYVGDRRAEYKNFSLVVDACLLSGESLLIIGGGPLTAKEVRSLSRINYKFLGFVNDAKLGAYYSIAKCLLYPSISEGFGIPVIEAQKQGCVVITTTESCLLEVSGGAALFLNELTPEALAKCLKRVNHSKEEMMRLRELGIKNSRRFSWSRTRNETMSVYEGLLKSGI